MHFARVLLSLLSVGMLFFQSGCIQKSNQPRLPGQYADYTLLPNGWKLTPAGDQVEIGELPLNLVISADQNYAVTSNSGAGDHTLSVVDLNTMREVQQLIIRKTWRGLDFGADGQTLYVSGGNDDQVNVYDFQSGRLTLRDSITGPVETENEVSVSGIDYHDESKRLFTVSKKSNSLYIIEMPSKRIIKTLPFEAECFDVKVNHAGSHAYVSVWGAAKVVEIELSTFAVSAEFNVGDHPCEILITKDDSRLFVTNANNNTTSVIDLKRKREIERISSALKPDAPYGSTPNAICFNKDETRLFIANADNNYLAMFDISEPGESRSLGFIPVGWYPTSVKYAEKLDRLVVANGKGLTSKSNPKGPKPGQKVDRSLEEYIGRLFKGTLSSIPVPDDSLLAFYSEKVYQNTPYYSKNPSWKGVQSVIPEEHNQTRSTKIRHVFYIIKENRTYDQVFGDIPQGNGDSSLCLFPEEVTPNKHKLALEFTLFDNFYVDAEVSADGHNWSTAAYASDFVEKTWPTLYGRKGGSYEYEGGSSIAPPSSGFIWDNVLENGLIYRNYGEFVERHPEKDGMYRARDEYLRPHTCEPFPGYDLSITDVYRYERWEEDFSRLEKEGNIPDLSIMRLPNDHTAGTREGYPTVRAMVADNDYAVGLVVDRISKSSAWENSIIFIVEDDAQNGSDHVDAHRSPLLVIGPHVRRGFLDNTHYSTSSVLKTIELVLGLKPMTQYDLSATPILFAITDDPDLQPYDHVKPKVDINEMNRKGAYGAKRSAEMNLAVEDAIPDVEFNEIIWKAVKGADSEMPPPVRSAFVQITNHDEDDDSD